MYVYFLLYVYLFYVPQPLELGKKYDGNFIFTFAVVRVRCGGITTVKNFKHGNYLK